ncbi:hypothetical protein LSAT2_021148 [Lamellibrachia satsuma]|nr:hypothetical protein LSAT2_021148 [Lamellibrachia satsuma]
MSSYLSAYDTTAFPARTTPVRLHEPSSRHVRLFHDILTAGLLSVQPTVQLSSPRATPVRPRQPSSRKSPSPRLIDDRPTDLPADHWLGNTAAE